MDKLLRNKKEIILFIAPAFIYSFYGSAVLSNLPGGLFFFL